MKVYKNLFSKISDPENLFLAWEEFKKGKNAKNDVQKFELNLEENILDLAGDLRSKKYKHAPYEGFFISDPKLRHIHKAIVGDRVLHHAIFQVLNPIFEPTFISNSFSCRIGKGTHNGVLTVENMLRKVSRNYTHHCYTLKCDVRKFFDTIDHFVLLSILENKIKDKDTTGLLKEIIGSYKTGRRERERERESTAARWYTHRESDFSAFRQCLYE